MITYKAHADVEAPGPLHCYKSVLDVAALALSIFFAWSAPAAEPDFLHLSKTKLASERIERFLIPGTSYTGRLELLKDLEVEGSVAIHLIFKMALKEMDRPKVGEGSRLRVGLLLLPALQFAHARPKFEEHVLNAVKEKADQLLEVFSHRSGDQDVLISIFNHLNLWSVDNFWFFLKSVKNRSVLMNLYPSIKKIIPFMSEVQLTELGKKLREVSPADTLQLGLLLDIGLMSERELKTFFVLTAQRFSNRRAYRSAIGENHPQTWQDRKDEALAPALKKLKTALEQKDPVVVSAFKKARVEAEGGDQAEFFRQFAGEPSRSKVAHYEVEENVILVDFKLRSRCQTDLR